jgi:type II secretory pathway pseudopilin PulG
MKGQSLIEVLVALGIISLIVTTIASIVTSSLGNTQFSKDQNTATKYAQEGLEITRSARNSDYNAFSVLNGTYCLAKSVTALGSVQGNCAANIDNYYIRKIQIELVPGCGNNVSKVIATVAWQDGKCTGNTYCHKSNLVTCLSRVNPVQVP